MIRKIFATVAVAAAVLLAAPATATAQEGGTGYVGQGTNVTLTVGQVGTMTFTGLAPSSPSTATAPDAVTLAVLKASTASRPTDATGTVSYQVSSNTPGTYTITATAGQYVATGTLTVVPADTPARASGSLSGTGFDLPVLWLWIGGGALILGAALIVVLTTVRRSRNDS
ncbi:hypothetical protein FLP10_03930 [Agromyces intestinalis]|uniref:Carboxypeptidase regulatory-like domain-containing protein n=1 Tax=Agromyces intestinalis TaxID=2592652 RepID=A0A5C1YC44_9MICO|nr:hypothetical protein [Agromyces intestinalis]QEO13664.1 hypothetical protein FLP10_03930 [Agromyces intestinalis]